MQTETSIGYFSFLTPLPDGVRSFLIKKIHLNNFFPFMETRLNTLCYYLFLHRTLHVHIYMYFYIHVLIYLSGTILNGSFLQNIGDGEHIISPVCKF